MALDQRHYRSLVGNKPLRRFRTLLIENELEGETETNADDPDDEIEADAEDADDPDENVDEREKAVGLRIEANSVHSLDCVLGPYERIDKLLVAAERRRDRILRELELRSERIAPLLRQGV